MSDRRGRSLILAAGVFLILMSWCFGRALVGGGQFAYRDAGHFYYPLYQRVQTEWNEGRWPLWEPEENAGMPLMGNPTAAVLYPGKVIYAALPYPWAARIYVVAHITLAFGAMLWLMRGWGTSWEGSTISALSYAFGAPILFQYCNIIFLVGAAWLPLGFLALERWIRGGSARALPCLAVVLAMQTLGGDPQAALLLGLCGGGYAAGLAWSRGRSGDDRQGDVSRSPKRSRRACWLWPLLLAGLALWVVGTVVLAEYLPTVRPRGRPTPALPWMRYMPRIMALCWAAAGAVFLARFRRGGRWSPLGLTLLGLATAAGLAAMLTAAQLLPVIEFTQQTVRAEGEGPHDIYPFSLEPLRLTELLWPSVLGTTFGRNAYWIDAFRLPGVRPKIWSPIYVGGFAVVLALGAFSLREGPPQRRWLSAIVALSLLGSMGQYTSPIWAARLVGATTRWKVPDIGPLDTNEVTPIRLDGYLRDGDGGIYWWMTTVLPGFRQFRFPVKLFTFTALGLTALGGMGFDLLARGGNRTARSAAAALAALSLAGLVAVLIGRSWILGAISSTPETSAFGPLDPEAGLHELARSLAHGLIVFALVLAIVRVAGRSLPAAGVLAVICVAADLGIANSRHVTTVPQELLEGESEAVRIIREAEREKPSAGPFRVHRMPQWSPPEWLRNASDDRIRDFVTWERATIQPKYGITQGVEYTHTMGVAELYDLEWFFGGFPYTVKGQTAESLGIAPGQKVVYFPRRSFNLWGSRYFILPQFPNGWMDEFRGYAAFLHETEQIYPRPGQFRGEGKEEALRQWVEKHDLQIRRNLREFPRAWVVHEARGLPPLEGKSRAERSGPMQEILYDADPIWYDPTLPVHDPARVAWIDAGERLNLGRFVGGQAPTAAETVKVTYPNPQRVELQATLESPGLVILADVFYPGWTLTIDGQPAPIIRVNRLMRGAAVDPGKHHLVYTYEPHSFRVGGWISVAGLGLLALLSLGLWLRPAAPGPWASPSSDEA
ncbi:MAG: hypothetical protein U0790_13090 [Isosphaeraceae bacterium]